MTVTQGRREYTDKLDKLFSFKTSYYNYLASSLLQLEVGLARHDPLMLCCCFRSCPLGTRDTSIGADVAR
jgi:hypothetical protein